MVGHNSKNDISFGGILTGKPWIGRLLSTAYVSLAFKVLRTAASPVADLRIWDFNLGTSRNQNESSALEVGYGTNNAGFMIKSYSDLLKECSFSNTKVLEDI